MKTYSKGHACNLCGAHIDTDMTGTPIMEGSLYTRYDFDLCKECKPKIPEPILKLFEVFASRIDGLEKEDD